MENLFKSLNDSELDWLDEFLLDRVDEEADTKDLDEGILVVSELDGFLTAIVSGPVTVPPSQWLPAVWGDFEPVWKNEKDFSHVMSLMVRHMNVIAATLMEQPQLFEPMFDEIQVKDEITTNVEEWCQGYIRGVSLAMDEWEQGGHEMVALLTPIMAFVSDEGWQQLREMTDQEVDNLKSAIAPNVREIHAYWLARREDSGPSQSPVRYSEPRVGRNDPCPCGSGKKYKKCCLH